MRIELDSNERMVSAQFDVSTTRQPLTWLGKHCTIRQEFLGEERVYEGVVREVAATDDLGINRVTILPDR